MPNWPDSPRRDRKHDLLVAGDGPHYKSITAALGAPVEGASLARTRYLGATVARALDDLRQGRLAKHLPPAGRPPMVALRGRRHRVAVRLA